MSRPNFNHSDTIVTIVQQKKQIVNHKTPNWPLKAGSTVHLQQLSYFDDTCNLSLSVT